MDDERIVYPYKQFVLIWADRTIFVIVKCLLFRMAEHAATTPFAKLHLQRSLNPYTEKQTGANTDFPSLYGLSELLR